MYIPYSQDRQNRLLDPAKQAGGPRSMTAKHCLGLILTLHRNRGAAFLLCMLLRIKSSVCSIFLRFGCRILLRARKKHPISTVIMPPGQEISEYQREFSSKYPRLRSVLCVDDGLKLYLEQYVDYAIQNMLFNGWKDDH